MIKLENVSKFYSAGGNITIGIQNVSAEFHKGEIVAIVGESGSGKSTFLNVVSSLDSFEEGEIYYDSEPVSGMTPLEIERFRKNHIAFIFQNYNLVDSYSVLENVMIPLLIRGKSRKEAKARALEILKEVGLEHRVRNRGSKLSGGEKQRCVIARALASDSDIIACDEPTGNLDSKTGKEIIDLIKRVSKDKLVLIVTHNLKEVLDMATRLIKFHDGSIESDEIISSEAIEEETSLVSDEKLAFGFKNKVLMALTNILSTPKKTIFLFFLYFAIAFFSINAFSSYIEAKNSLITMPSEIYMNTDSGRVVIYDENHSALDTNAITNALGDSVIYNSYYEDYKGVIPAYSYSFLFDAADYKTIKYVYGKAPANDSEIALGISKASYESYYDLVGTELQAIDKKPYKITGLFVNDTKQQDNIYVYATEPTAKRWISYINLQLLTTTFNGNNYNDYIVDNTMADKTIVIRYKYSSYFSLSDFSYSINNCYNLNLEGYDVSLVYNEYCTTPELHLSLNTADSLFNENIYQVSTYITSNDDYSSIHNKMTSLGYESVRPSTIDTSNILVVLINCLLIGFTLIGIFFAFLVIYFLSYVILQRVYHTKIKDYAIFRTLGTSKKDLSQIVTYETFFMCLFSVLCLFIIEFILLQFGISIINVFNSFKVYEFILFIFLMIIFSYLFSRRFNRKIFKFTVQTTLKKEVL